MSQGSCSGPDLAVMPWVGSRLDKERNRKLLPSDGQALPIISSFHPVPSNLQHPLGWAVIPQHWWLLLFPLAAEVPRFGLHPQWGLNLHSAKSCHCGYMEGRWTSLRCVLWSLKAMWEEGKVNYMLVEHLVLPMKCSAAAWWAPRSDRRALAAVRFVLQGAPTLECKGFYGH